MICGGGNAMAGEVVGSSQLHPSQFDKPVNQGKTFHLMDFGTMPNLSCKLIYFFR